jgi:hypothetical protein
MGRATAALLPGQPVTLPPAAGISFEIEAGQKLKLTQPEGEQVADLISFNRDDPRELLSMLSSRAVNLCWKLTAPHVLYSNCTRAMWQIEEDLTGENYCGGGYCSEHLNVRRYGDVGKGAPNCQANLEAAIRGYGLDRWNFNVECLFQRIHDRGLRRKRRVGNPCAQGQAGRLHGHARADAADRRHLELPDGAQRLQQLPAQAAHGGDLALGECRRAGSMQADETGSRAGATKMQRIFAAFVLLLLSIVSVAPAQADNIIQLKHPIIGCTEKADLGHFSAELPPGISRADTPLAYRQGRCIRIPIGPIRIERAEGTYTCLQARRHSCLWVRSEEIGRPIIGDEPFKPSSNGRERAVPSR